jgi:hypothetical protein
MLKFVLLVMGLGISLWSKFHFGFWNDDDLTKQEINDDQMINFYTMIISFQNARKSISHEKSLDDEDEEYQLIF